MSERQGEGRPDPSPPDLVVHKATRECPMIEPHARALCGIVRAREEIRTKMDEQRRRAGGQPGG